MQPDLPVIPDCHGQAWQSPPGGLVWNQETPYYDHTFTGKPWKPILAAVHNGRYATLRSTTRWLKPHPCSSNA